MGLRKTARKKGCYTRVSYDQVSALFRKLRVANPFWDLSLLTDYFPNGDRHIAQFNTTCAEVKPILRTITPGFDQVVKNGCFGAQDFQRSSLGKRHVGGNTDCFDRHSLLSLLVEPKRTSSPRHCR